MQIFGVDVIYGSWRHSGTFTPQNNFCSQVASRWVRVSGPAAPGQLDGTGTPRGEGAGSENRKDQAAGLQHHLASPSTPSQHLLPVALLSPATSSVRVTVCLGAYSLYESTRITY